MPNQSIRSDTRRFNFWVPGDYKTQLEREAANQGISLGELIREVLRKTHFPDRVDPINERMRLRRESASGATARKVRLKANSPLTMSSSALIVVECDSFSTPPNARAVSSWSWSAPSPRRPCPSTATTLRPNKWRHGSPSPPGHYAAT